MNQVFKKPVTYLCAVLLGIGIAAVVSYWHYKDMIPSDISFLRAAFLQGNLLVQKVVPESFWSRDMKGAAREDIEAGVRLGADWLLSMQTPQGRFQYWYDPVGNRYSHPGEDNFLRQAGTAYAMALAYEQTGNPRYLEAVQRSVAYQSGFLKRFEQDKAYFLFRGKAKLGGIALPMLTMMKLRDLTGTEEFDPVLKPCAEMILYLQEQYGSGQYKSSYIYNGKYDYEKVSGWESNIYPGETMLALAWMYRIFNDERYRQSIDRARDFYYLKERWTAQAFLPWTISAMSMMFETTNDKAYADYAVFLTDRLLKQQILNPRINEVGGFSAIPSINTSAYLEGLGDAIRVAEILRDDKLEERYRHSMILGVHWILQLQCQPDHADRYPEPHKALGGFSTRKTLARQRIDNTQHAISALIRALRRIHDQAPVVAFRP